MAREGRRDRGLLAKKDSTGKTVKDFLIELAEARIQELERKGILPKGK